MSGILYNSVYPWNTTSEPPSCMVPLPFTPDEVAGNWKYGKIKIPPVEKQLPQSITYTFNNVDEFVFPPMKEKHISKDEYIWYQFCPTDTLSAWKSNEQIFKKEHKNRVDRINLPKQFNLKPWEDWDEKNFQRHWNYRNLYNIDELLYKVNLHGFRADDFHSTKNSNRRKIMFLGCSFTFGIGARNEEIWPHLVSEKFDAVNWNMGVGGSSPKLAVMLAEHMFRIGYIPEFVCVNWPSRFRNVLVNRSKFEKMLDSHNDTINETSSMNEQIKKWQAIADAQGMADLFYAESKNDDGFTLPDINPTKFDPKNFNDYPNHTWSYMPSDGTDKENKLLKAVNTTDAFKSQEYLNGTEHELLMFNDLRAKLRFMCKAYGVKLIETFCDSQSHRLALEVHKHEEDWISGTPVDTSVFNFDRARDGSHWGPVTHQIVARLFAERIEKHI